MPPVARRTTGIESRAAAARSRSSAADCRRPTEIAAGCQAKSRTQVPAIAPDWQAVPAELRSLWAWTLAMLFMPRVLGLAAVFLRRAQGGFGGTRALLGSALLETLVALLQAPVRMLAHSFFVLVALTGWKLEWKSPPREAEGIRWADAARKLGLGQSLHLPALLDPKAVDHTSLSPPLTFATAGRTMSRSSSTAGAGAAAATA